MRWSIVLLAAWAGMAQAGSYTSTAACAEGCAWSSAASWTPSGAPGNGDTVTIANGHTVRADQDVTVGTSGPNGTAAVTLNGKGSDAARGYASLIIATGVTFTVRGDVTPTQAGWVGSNRAIYMEPGSTWEWDSSAAADPANTKYKWTTASASQYRAFESAGTAEQRCTVRSNAGGGNGYFTVLPWFNGASVVAFYTDFVRIGDAATPGWQTDNWWDATYSTFTACGAIYLSGAIDGTGIRRHNYNVHVNTQSAYTINLYALDAKTTGTRELIGNVFDQKVSDSGHLSTASDFTIADNYFGNGIQFAGTRRWAAFSRNLLRVDAAHYSNPILLLAGDASDNYIFIDGTMGEPPGNPHTLQFTASLGNLTATRMIIDPAGEVSAGEIFVAPTTNPAAPTQFTIEESLNLPDAAGLGMNFSSLGASSNAQFHLLHNTAYVNGTGAMIEQEDPQQFANQIQEAKSNAVWGPAANPGLKSFDYSVAAPGTTAVTNAIVPSGADYNAGWNLQAKRAAYTAYDPYQQKGWASKFDDYPGAHDMEADPMFLDGTRKAATFDVGYLGQASGTPWASGAAHNVGDIVSHVTSTFYNGVTLNYRCIAAHTSDASTQPGVGASWRVNWELASLYRLREGVASRQKFSDGATGAEEDSVIMALAKWVRRGYAPQNGSFRRAGHDGRDIGAVPMPPEQFAAAPVVF